MKPKEKAINYLNKKKWWMPSDISEKNKEVRIFNHALDIAIKEAKKEVFGDIGKTFRLGSVSRLWLADYNELKEKHLGLNKPKVKSKVVR